MRTTRAGRFYELGKLGAKVTASYASLSFKDGSAQEGLIDEKNRRNARLLAETLTELKGPILKMGQLATLFDAYLPPDLAEAFALLHDEVPPEKKRAVHKVFKAEMGAPPGELFAEFDDEPVAGASLGQVHRARLPDGREAAIKVQYPGARKALDSDFKMLGTLVGMARAGQAALGKGVDLKGAFRELRAQIALELDYFREKENLLLFRRIFENHPDVCVPRVYEEFCASRVLAMEYLEGERLRRALPELDTPARERIGRALVEAFARPLLDHGVLHADPHPGNYLVMPDGRLGLLDYGCVKRFSPAAHSAFRVLYGGICREDAESFVEAARVLGLSIREEEARAMFGGSRGRVPMGEGVEVGEAEEADDLVERSVDLIFAGFYSIQDGFFPPELVFFGRALAGLYAHLSLLDVDVDTSRIIADCLGDP